MGKYGAAFMSHRQASQSWEVGGGGGLFESSHSCMPEFGTATSDQQLFFDCRTFVDLSQNRKDEFTLRPASALAVQSSITMVLYELFCIASHNPTSPVSLFPLALVLGFEFLLFSIYRLLLC